MAAPHSEKIRACIIMGHEKGDTQTEIAENLNIAQSTVSRIIAQFNTEGNVVPKKPGGGNDPLIKESDYYVIEEILEKDPCLTLFEIAEKAKERLKIDSISKSTIDRILNKLGITRKKKSKVSTEQDRDDVKKKSRLSGCSR